MAFVKVCATGDVPEGEGIKLEQGPDPVALFNADGEFYAIGDTCTHGDWSLSEGYMEECEVECTLHMAKFCIKTGRVTAPPANAPVKSYPVKVEGDDVLVDFDAGVLPEGK